MTIVPGEDEVSGAASSSSTSTTTGSSTPGVQVEDQRLAGTTTTVDAPAPEQLQLVDIKHLVESNTRLLGQLASLQLAKGAVTSAAQPGLPSAGAPSAGVGSSSAGPGAAKLNLEKFDPGHHIAEEWLQDFDDHTEAWEEPTRLNAFKRYLGHDARGQYRTWIEEKTPAERSALTLEDCYAWLLGEYAPRNPLELYTSQLEQLQLKPGERVQTLWRRLLAKVRGLSLAARRLKVKDPSTEFNVKKWFYAALPKAFEADVRKALVNRRTVRPRDVVDTAVELENIALEMGVNHGLLSVTDDSKIVDKESSAGVPLSPAIQRLRYSRTWTAPAADGDSTGSSKDDIISKLVEEKVAAALKSQQVLTDGMKKKSTKSVTFDAKSKDPDCERRMTRARKRESAQIAAAVADAVVAAISPQRDPGSSGDINAGGPRQERRRCYNCNEIGHISRFCPKPSTRRRKLSCFRCGSAEHLIRDCPLPDNRGARGVPAAASHTTANVPRSAPAATSLSEQFKEFAAVASAIQGLLPLAAAPSTTVMPQAPGNG